MEAAVVAAAAAAGDFEVLLLAITVDFALLLQPALYCRRHGASRRAS